MSARGVLALAGVLCALMVAMVAVPMTAGLLYAGHLPQLSAADAARGSARVAIEGRWSDPARAYPRGARREMPAAASFWMTAALLISTGACLAVALGRRLEVRMATSRLARRWFEITGTNPRSWARPRDLRSLWVSRRTPGRLTLGTIGRMRRLVAAEHETHVAVIAPTGSGKSTRFIIPWVLEAEGPAVVCSTKLDVVEATRAHRERMGEVFVWDPFGPETAGWSPLAGCESWEGALRRAKWMSSALGESEHGAARFWNGEAAKLLAPLLHAAALDRDGTMSDVLDWLDRPETGLVVAERLEIRKATQAAGQLMAVLDLDDRNKGTTYMSAAHLVEAYRYPAVQGSDRREVTPKRLLEGGRANTLYIVAAEDEQEMLAPLVVGMLAEILSYAQREARLEGRQLDRVLRVLMDETANIAPIEQLPKYLSGVRGARIRIVTVWQDLAQLRSRYRDATGTILSNSQVKVFLGPITDEDTRKFIAGVLGDERISTTTQMDGDRRSRSTGQTWRPRAEAQALQQLGRGRGLLLHTDLPAAVIDTTPWFENAHLRRLVATDEARDACIRHAAKNARVSHIGRLNCHNGHECRTSPE